MSEPSDGAWVDDAGKYRFSDAFDGVEIVWNTAADVAADWWSDSVMRSGSRGEFKNSAHSVLEELSDAGHSGGLAIIQALVDLASSDEELDFVGASPLEDLLSHNHHGAKFVDEVELRARQQPRFRTALRGVWLGQDVSADVRARLGALGAKLL